MSHKFDEGRLREWREKVLNKCGHRCKKCGSSRNLHAHHIKQKSIQPKYAYTVSNGVCLCRKCHMDLHKKIGFGKHSYEEVRSLFKKKHKSIFIERRNKPIRVVYKPKKLKYRKIKIPRIRR